jgi:hypothetical protein
MAFNYPIGSGGKPPAKAEPKAMPEQEQEPEGEDGGADEKIQSHLQEMHAATGHGHSHIQHHPDGTHTAHHVSHEGEMSGPEPHADCPGGMCSGGM